MFGRERDLGDGEVMRLWSPQTEKLGKNLCSAE